MITGRQIQDESVTGRDIRNNSLGGTDVNESSLATVPSARSARSAQSAQNAQHAGSASSIGNLDYNVSDPVANPSGSQNAAAVGCDPGQVAVGGGVEGSDGSPGQQSVNSSYPLGPGGWGAWVDNTGPENETFAVYVICTKAGSVSKAPGDAAPKK